MYKAIWYSSTITTKTVKHKSYEDFEIISKPSQNYGMFIETAKEIFLT